ncbi:MAG: TetR/AcrR family transcriptional regulator [Acidimicrobiales bacterium]
MRSATTLLDAEGPEALTMRRLADDLGIQAPSLYKHVRDKAVVEAAVVEDALLEMGDALHASLRRPGRAGPVGAVLAAYRAQAQEHPHRYRLATTGELRRHLLAPDVEDWAGHPFYVAADHDPQRAQALWSCAHGMSILEIDGRYPEGSDLDATWRAAARAFGPPTS